MALRDDILAAEDLPVAAVMVREWNNAKVFIRSITYGERIAYDRETVRRQKDEPDRIQLLERLIILCATDEHGAPLFKAGDEDALARKSNAGMMRLFRIASKHNGFDRDDGGEPENP